MFMTPISLPSCQPRPVMEDLPEHSDGALTLLGMEAFTLQPSSPSMKRASIHMTEGSTSSKRISVLLNNSRCRSFSESWAFLAASPVAPLDSVVDRSANAATPLEDDASSQHSSDLFSSPSFSESYSSSSSTTTPTSPSPVPSPHDPSTCTTLKNVSCQDLPDQELLKSLAAFLLGGSSGNHNNNNNPYDDDFDIRGFVGASSAGVEKVSTPFKSTHSQKSDMCDLVVTVRDFAYPKSHPYHLGNYPPEPSYEESDVEDDQDDIDDNDDQEEDFDTVASWASSSAPFAEVEDRTQGRALGLYDFDAENSSELTFKEGDYLWIHCRQFPGWFLGEMDGAQGLVPENYVQMV